MADSVVTVEFHDGGKETEVVLRHEGLTDADSRARHEHGWKGCLDNLVALMQHRCEGRCVSTTPLFRAY